MLRSLDCPNCGKSEDLFVSLGKVRAEKAFCPHCTGVRREVKTFFRIGNEDGFDLQNMTLAQIGVPPLDIVIARNGAVAVGFEFAADLPRVLGPLSVESEALSWE